MATIKTEQLRKKIEVCRGEREAIIREVGGAQMILTARQAKLGEGSDIQKLLSKMYHRLSRSQKLAQTMLDRLELEPALERTAAAYAIAQQQEDAAYLEKRNNQRAFRPPVPSKHV